MVQLKNLPNILGANVANDDLIILDDRSEDTTKKITIDELGEIFTSASTLNTKADISFVVDNYATKNDLRNKQNREVKVTRLINNVTITEDDWGALLLNEGPSSITVTLPTIPTGFQIFLYALGGPIVLNPEVSSIGSSLIVSEGSISSAWFDGINWIIASLSPNLGQTVKSQFIAGSNLLAGNLVKLNSSGQVVPFIPALSSQGLPSPSVVGVVDKPYNASDDTVIVYSKDVTIPNVLTGLGFVVGDTVCIGDTGQYSATPPTKDYQFYEVGYAINSNDLLVDVKYRGLA